MIAMHLDMDTQAPAEQVIVSGRYDKEKYLLSFR